MKNLLICTVLITSFLHLNLLAQGSFKPGFIILDKSDTLKGLLRYIKKSNEESVLFRPTASAQVQKLKASNIKAFKINGSKTYELYIGPVSLGTIAADHMMTYRDTSVRLDTIFLQVIETGKAVTLYSYTDNLKTRFFIREHTQEKSHELLYRLYYDHDHPDITAGKGKTVNENIYMEQLFVLAARYKVLTPSFQRQIEHSPYSKAYLTDIVSAINKGLL